MEAVPEFMSKIKGPPQQFLILVGDDDGVVEAQIREKSLKTDDEGPDVFFINNNYYCCKYGLRKFNNYDEAKKDHDKEKVARPFLAVIYKGIDDLVKLEKVDKELEPDSKVVIFESLASLGDDADEAEAVALDLGFEFVYLNPTEDQEEEAADICEKVGIDRLMETIEVCSWPFRVANLTKKTGMLDYDDDEEPVEENVAGSQGVMDGKVAKNLAHSFVMWSQIKRAEDNDIGPPQRAEAVHLSSGSPTTTEGTVNQEENNITVDFDFVNHKINLQDNNEVLSSAEKKPIML